MNATRTQNTIAETASLIADKAQSLAYEAVRFPSTAPVALAWLHRALAWAEANRVKELERVLVSHGIRISASTIKKAA